MNKIIGNLAEVVRPEIAAAESTESIRAAERFYFRRWLAESLALPVVQKVFLPHETIHI